MRMLFDRRRLLHKGERWTIFDLEGDPRYDVDAMSERTARLKAKTRELRKQMDRQAHRVWFDGAETRL